MRLLPYGDAAILVELDDPDRVLGLAEFASSLPAVCEVVPAARTVLVVVEAAGAVARVEEALLRAPTAFSTTGGIGAPGDAVVLDVTYDGPDLADTAAELGLQADGLVRAHADAEYVVAFCGFVPGFAYLSGLPESLHVARLAEPRTRVPAGSVGIAGEFAGIYPRQSPGGWRLLGRTDALLWDAHRTPPALLSPGAPVRFNPI